MAAVPKMTTARRRLLRAVKRGDVLMDPYGQAAYADADGTAGVRCTAVVGVLAAAGWIVRPGGDQPKWKKVELTMEGQAALNQAQ